MNKDTLKGNWKILAGEVKTKWNRLTDDEVGQIEGNLDKLVGAIQKNYGKSREEAAEEIDRWTSEKAA